MKSTPSNLKTLFLFGLVSSSLWLSGCVPNQQTIASNSPKQAIKIDPKVSKSKVVADITEEKALPFTPPEAVYHDNVWSEMRLHFDLAHQYFGHYDDYLRFYHQRKRHLETVSVRAKPYLYYIFNEVKKRNMPYEIALLPIVESGFQPLARSHQRAVGLWQFIPSTAELFDLDRTWWYDGRKDIIKSTQAALDYLEKLYRLNNNDWLLALASYNGGIGNVYKAQKRYRKKHRSRPGIADYQPNFWEIRPYLPRETQAYVPKLLAVSHIIEYADRFQVELEPVDNQPFFQQIELDKQVALNQVSKLTGTPMALLASLNPGYHQPATPPTGPHHLLLPIPHAERLNKALKTDSSIFDIQWKKHRIRPGDSLSVIAYRYKTSSKAIQKLNGLKNSRIRAGKTLLIPVPVQNAARSTQLASTSNLPVNSSKTPDKATKGVRQTHVVKTGDSLWKIARKYQTSTDQLAAWNGISPQKPLQVGQSLTIYLQQNGNKIVHTIQAGESLWTLAKRYQVSTRQIAKWNGISIKKVLQPGMKLAIWIEQNGHQSASTGRYIVKTGDNLWEIAKANKISAKKLANHNNLTLNSLLQPGQVLSIPKSS